MSRRLRRRSRRSRPRMRGPRSLSSCPIGPRKADSPQLLRIGPPDTQGANTVVITGGLHARRWVPPDALINLAVDLTETLSEGTGLRYGGERFSAADIHSVVTRLQVVLFPCVNPDGRHHSQNAEPMSAQEPATRKRGRRSRLCRGRYQSKLRCLVGFPPSLCGEFACERFERSLRRSSLRRTSGRLRGRDAECRLASRPLSTRALVYRCAQPRPCDLLQLGFRYEPNLRSHDKFPKRRHLTANAVAPTMLMPSSFRKTTCAH